MEKQWGRAEILGKYAPYAVRIQEGQWGRRRGEEGENKLSGGDEIGNSAVADSQ